MDFCKDGGEGEAVIAGECPGETRDGCEDVEEGCKDDDAFHDDEEIGCGLGACGLVVDLDDGQEVCGDYFDVARLVSPGWLPVETRIEARINASSMHLKPSRKEANRRSRPSEGDTDVASKRSHDTAQRGASKRRHEG